jgi:hypothetical protein
MDYGDGDLDTGGNEEAGDNDVIGELLGIKDQIDALLTRLGYESEGDTEEVEDEFGGDNDEEGNNDFGGDDLEDLEREAVEYEDVTGKKEELQKKSNQKASSKTGDLDLETSKKEGMEKNYKFVKVNKPQELKYKTTK